MTVRKAIDLSPERRWTATGDMLLVQLIAERFTLPEICAILNRSAQSVRRRVRLLRQNEGRQQEIIRRMVRAQEGSEPGSGYCGVRSGRVHFR